MILAGIDTGVHTGVALWDTAEKRFLSVTTTGIVRAMDLIRETAASGKGVTVFLEDARLRKWIPREKSLSQFKGRAMGAGSVKRDSAIWEEFCKEYRIPVHLIAPARNTTKLSAEAFSRITGWTLRTSSHARDAAMLVFQRRPDGYFP